MHRHRRPGQRTTTVTYCYDCTECTRMETLTAGDRFADEWVSDARTADRIIRRFFGWRRRYNAAGAGGWRCPDHRRQQ